MPPINDRSSAATTDLGLRVMRRQSASSRSRTLKMGADDRKRTTGGYWRGRKNSMEASNDSGCAVPFVHETRLPIKIRS
jgi:hypothetical protein